MPIYTANIGNLLLLWINELVSSRKFSALSVNGLFAISYLQQEPYGNGNAAFFGSISWTNILQLEEQVPFKLENKIPSILR